MVQMDITAMQYPDHSFDCIICNHVLEHIVDELKAMRELHRVLKPGVWAILQVPMSLTLEKTYEDLDITEPNEREKAFGRSDHVRNYGSDYKATPEQVWPHKRRKNLCRAQVVAIENTDRKL